MAMLPVTDPFILDSTGQQILSALQDIAEATQPTNVYIDLEVTLPASGWSNATPSSYTWTSEQVTTECAVEVYFANGSENVLTPYIQYEKGSQSVVFTSPAKPNANIPVIIRIINAKAESINNVTDEMVSTSTTSGASNVKQALTKINSDISSLNSNVNNLNQHYNPNNNGNVYTGDLNDLKESGNWLSTSGTNRPLSGGEWLSITVSRSYKDNSGYILSQTAISIIDGRTFIRALNGSTWSNWQELALNSKVDTIGTATTVISENVNITTSYATTGKTFTISKTSIVSVSQGYTNALPLAIGVKSQGSTYGASFIYTENYGQEESVGALWGHGVLTAGTYEVWAKAKGNVSNGIRVDIVCLRT